MVTLNQPELNLAFEQYNLRSRCYKHVLYYCNAKPKVFRLFFVRLPLLSLGWSWILGPNWLEPSGSQVDVIVLAPGLYSLLHNLGRLS
jgi:hypothetical protein